MFSAIGRSGAAVSSICSGAGMLVHPKGFDRKDLPRSAISSTVDTKRASEVIDRGCSRSLRH